MSDDSTPVRPPLTAVEIVNLQQRVLRGEEVSDEDLRFALSCLVQTRSTAASRSAPAKSKSDPVVKLEGSVAERFAAFKKQKETANSDT